MLLHQLAQHVGKQVGNFGRNALRAVQPRHGRKVGAEDESHRIDEEEFFRSGGFCHRREYSKAARAAGVCYFIGSRFLEIGNSRREDSPPQCPNAPKKTRRSRAPPRSAQPERTQAAVATQPDLKKPTIAEIFGPGGALEKCMPEGYEHRPSQLEMAELVEAAFREKRHLIVEAGTGTGKTLAYLIPAIRSGRRVVISTATKSLQEQLFEKDIPFLQKHFAPELKVAVMKGRGNFLCREKVYRMADQPVLKGLDELDWFHADSRLGKSDGDGRPRGTQFSARRFRPVAAPRRAARCVLGIEMPGIQPLLHHGDAPARRRSRPDHRESSSVFRRPGAEAGRFRQRACRNTAR